MPIYTFRCEYGHSVETLTGMDVMGVVCRECGDIAERVPFNRTAPIRVFEEQTFTGRDIALSVQTQNGRIDPSARQTRDKFRLFQEATQEIDYAASRVEADTGVPVQGADLWARAKRGAQQMISAGQAPVPASSN